MSNYDEHQKDAQELTCPKCGSRYFVTNAPKDWICACCSKRP